MPGSSIKSYLVALAAIPVLFCPVVNADFDEATKAYLLGQYEKARYEALIDASDGNPKAQMLLGQLYFKGEGVEKDLDHALYWYNKAANNGFADAQFRLGMLYLDDKNGVKRNLNISYDLLSKALANGRTDAKETLEWLYKTEQGEVVNLDENAEVLKQVAASGNQQARFLLSQKMIRGDGLPQDRAGAVKILTEDAQVGFIKAQKQLGELFYYGTGVDKDYIAAYAWSMAYAGTRELGGIAREGKQIARSALRKLPQEEHDNAYLKSEEYYKKYVLPFHKNAREVGPDKYRIVVRSRVKKEELAEQRANKRKQLTQQTQQEPVKQNVEGQAPAMGSPSISAVPGVTDSGISSGRGDSKISNSTNETDKNPEAKTPPSTSPGEVTSNSAVSENEAPALAAPSDLPATQESTTIASKVEQETGDNLIAGKSETPVATSPEDAKPITENQKPLTDAGPVASREDMEVIPAVPLTTGSPIDETQPTTPVLAERKFDDVYNVLVRKKAGLYELYAREYELDKKLEGRVVFEIVITPEGKISSVEVISNTLESPTLEQEFIDYLKNSVTFASAEVAEFKITYPVDFLPP